jgi:N-methylhydantoinase B
MTALHATLREAHARLVRELRSHPLGDAGHLGVSVVHGGRLVATSSRAWIGNVLAVGAACAPSGLDPGVAVLTNDPFAGSPHVQDHWVVAGAADGALVVLQAHLADVGGQNLGSYNPFAGEVWQEGVRTTPAQLYRGGKLERDVLELVRLNSRLPELVAHDVVVLGETALELAAGLGPAEPEAAGPRQPAAAASVETTLHNCSGEDVTIALRITPGERIRFDFAGSSPQVQGFVNSTLATTTSAVVAASGSMPDEIEVDAPAGSVVNCSFPQATGWSSHGTYAAIASLVRRGLERGEPSLPGERLPPVRIDGCRREGCPF